MWVAIDFGEICRENFIHQYLVSERKKIKKLCGIYLILFRLPNFHSFISIVGKFEIEFLRAFSVFIERTTNTHS